MGDTNAHQQFKFFVLVVLVMMFVATEVSAVPDVEEQRPTTVMDTPSQSIVQSEVL